MDDGEEARLEAGDQHIARQGEGLGPCIAKAEGDIRDPAFGSVHA